MELLEEHINIPALRKALTEFKGNKPFDHCVVKNFFKPEIAEALSNEFPGYSSDAWFVYENAVENKKALNDWNMFPPLTYTIFTLLNSKEFIRYLEIATEACLYADNGLHGGGWHIHGQGGNLNPHLDYSIHPKLGLERKINIIIYISPEMDREEYGGHLGLYDNNSDEAGKVIKEIAPVFNQAVIFDTTQDSWHGMSRTLQQPEGVYRKSLAAYYLTSPCKETASRSRALFSPRKEQRQDKDVLDLIQKRVSEDNCSEVYRKE